MKTKFLFFLMFFCQCVIAQNHMKFMGIPIDGDVDVFCQKLQAKGLKHNPEEASNIKSFVGRFYGENAYFDINYDPVTKCVYEVAVSILKDFSLELYPLQKEIMTTIEEKYTFQKEANNPEVNQYDYYIYLENSPIGLIRTYIFDRTKFNQKGESMLSITYTDVDNYMTFENTKRKDI